MSRLGWPFAASYHPARPWLLTRGLFALLAFDLWLVMIEHGGRYGMGGFNVAHFAWLDAVLPLPTPTLYVGSLMFAGLASLLMALVGAPTFGKAVLCGAYTFAWSLSLHDSYQHHYLLSWLLAWTVFMPDVPADSAGRESVQRVQGWGLPMTALTCAIVYTFTAISKSEPAWRSGAVLMRLSKSKPPGDPNPGVMDPLRDALVWAFELTPEAAFTVIAHSVIALQICVAVGYLASLGRDERPTTLRALLTSLGWLGAASFHAFAELGHMFDIGWFSYYMLWISFVLLAPARWVARVAHVVAWPGRALAQRFEDARQTPSQANVLGQTLLAAGLLVLVGVRLDLPGAPWATVAVAGAVVVSCGLAVARTWLVSAQRLAVAAALSGVALWLSIGQSAVRFDYYRLAAGESQDMGDLDSALELYRKAERYAPKGKSRARRIEEIEKALRER